MHYHTRTSIADLQAGRLGPGEPRRRRSERVKPAANLVARVNGPKSRVKKSKAPTRPRDCRFGIEYVDETNPPCKDPEACGAVLHYRVARATAEGSDCPKFGGMRFTEKVSNDHGCIKDNFEPGPGCPINADGTASDCEDTYAFCQRPERFPADGCKETVTQQLFVGGYLAETRKIVWTIRQKPICDAHVDWKSV